MPTECSADLFGFARVEGRAVVAAWHQQRHVMAGGAIDLDEIAPPENLDPRYVDGQHSGAFVFLECSRKPR
jgi:hypothetical protein